MNGPSGAPRFRLGVTSFVYLAGWADNIERLMWGPAGLAGRVRDVELLFFEADRPDQLPSSSELARLQRVKEDASLSYTLHTPLNASLASEQPERRRHALEAIRRSWEVAQALQPERVVVHVYRGDREHDPRPPADLSAWRDRAAGSLSALIDGGIPARDLCVETIDYDYALVEPVVEQLGLSVALDVGHQLRDGRDPLALYARLGARARVIQWHGVDPTGRDHRSLAFYPAEHARALLRALRSTAYDGVLTLEVFSESDLQSSLRWLDVVQAGLDAAPERRT